MKVLLVSEAHLDKPFGKTIKITALAAELANNGIDVTIVVPYSGIIEPSISVKPNLKLHQVKCRGKTGTLAGTISRRWSLIKRVRKILEKENNTILLIEGMVLGGHFALAGFSDFVLNADALGFDEAQYRALPWFVPLKLYSKYSKTLEKLSVRRASRVIAISHALRDYLIQEFKIAETKIDVVPNGYFKSKITQLGNIRESEGMVLFVGLLAKWAKLDKLFKAADALKNESITFYIVGDGPSRGEFERMAQSYKLSNVVFTGYVNIDEAYRMIAESEVVLAPIDDSLAKSVGCPIKQIEYMALGKAMVIDDVGDIPALLKKHNAALVCNPSNDNEFIENVKKLTNSKELRRNIGSNAKRLSQDWSWEKQGKKLARILEEVGK